MISFQSHEQEIKRLHSLAQSMASDAIAHARAAGELLIEVKKQMEHGKFQQWVRDNAQVSLRQAQRYMAAAQGKQISLSKFIDKSDTVSHLPAEANRGVWKNGKWQPVHGYLYLFNEDNAAYWVLPTRDPKMGFHICKHYSGQRITSDEFYLHYTVLADVHDPDFTSHYYIGTKRHVTAAFGVEGILRSYGLQDISASFILGSACAEGFDRPFGEPPIEHWYWDERSPDYDLFVKFVMPAQKHEEQVF